MNNTKIFQILPNGKSVASLKKEAKLLHKSGKYKSYTSALNELSEDVLGLSFNKASPEIDISSPRIIGDTLYLPIKINLENYDLEGYFYYFIAINTEEISLHHDYKMDIKEHELKIDSTQLGNFERINANIYSPHTGWMVSYGNTKIYVKTADEGLVCDLFYFDDENYTEDECIDSVYVEYNEIFEEYYYEKVKNKKMSDYKASFLLNHTSDKDRTVLYSIGGAYLNLYSAVTLLVDDNYYDSSTILNLLHDKNIPENIFWEWLNGKEFKEFDNWKAETNPYFGLETNDGDIIGDIFDEIPATLSEKSLEIAQNF